MLRLILAVIMVMVAGSGALPVRAHDAVHCTRAVMLDATEAAQTAFDLTAEAIDHNVGAVGLAQVYIKLGVLRDGLEDNLAVVLQCDVDFIELYMMTYIITVSWLDIISLQFAGFAGNAATRAEVGEAARAKLERMADDIERWRDLIEGF